MKKLPRLTPKHIAVALVGLALLSVLSFVAFRMGPLAPVQITSARVENKALTPSIYGVGTVEAQQSWLLGPLAASRVLRVHVTVGQHVKAGQLLAEMDPLDLDQRVKSQEAALAKAESVLATVQAQLEDAQMRRAVANANWLRQKDLAQQSFISQGALESREQEWVSANAGFKVAQANLTSALQDIQKIQADTHAAALQRQSMRLLAPADAVVISRDAEAGSTVVAGQAVLRLAQPQSLWVRMRIDQGRSLGLAVGLPASIVLRANPHQTLAGKVARVEWQSDAVTEERIAQVSFDHLPANVSMGDTAELTLSLMATAPTLQIPQASVQQYQGRSGVWKLHANQLEFVDVELGAFSLDGWVQVRQGLKIDDEVVVYTEKSLTPNTRFKRVSALVKKAQP